VREKFVGTSNEAIKVVSCPWYVWDKNGRVEVNVVVDAIIED